VGEPGPHFILRACALLLAGTALAQGRATAPPVAADLPGNAAVSMPLRWSHGTMQVVVGSALLPANFVGQQLRGVRLRRPSFLGEGAYGGTQRTLTVRAGFTPMPPSAASIWIGNNRPPGLATVAGPALFTVAPSAPPTGAQALGSELLSIPFSPPLPVTAGNLFLEFEATGAPLAMGDEWVDAVWLEDGVDHGYAVTVGRGDCTLAATPLHLLWNGADGPLRGGNAELRLLGAPPGPPSGAGGLALAWVGVEPQARAPGGLFLGWGGDVGAIDAGLLGCRQWVPLDLTFFGATDGAGGYDLSFAVPPGVTWAGMRVGVQAGYVEPQRPGLPLSIANGVVLVLDSAGVANHCSTVFFPAAATVSPWPPDVGLMPVLVLDS
jgi:hypothetical protein